MYAINVRGHFSSAGACAQNMMDNGVQGSIVTIGSLVARGGRTMIGAYPSSKAAVIQFTKNLANVWRPWVSASTVFRRAWSRPKFMPMWKTEMMMEPGALPNGWSRSRSKAARF